VERSAYVAGSEGRTPGGGDGPRSSGHPGGIAAVFLDRDGVLNVDTGFACSPEEFAFTEDAPAAVKRLNDLGYLVIVVTNQSGIGRGLFNEDRFVEFTRWIEAELRSRGAHIDATYYCPHHPTEASPPYLLACACRKPEPGMLLDAIADWGIDASRSAFIGDAERDLEAARRAGVRGLLFEGGSLLEFVERAVQRP
jgi:D-glycero-D-manno-heptose 1,7-bisphosphate phosphatase